MIAVRVLMSRVRSVDHWLVVGMIVICGDAEDRTA
jgi:hypothetical protein